RDPLRGHEGAHLDHREPGADQRVDQPGTLVDRERLAFVLQPVARGHLHDGDAARQPPSISTSSVPGPTISPTRVSSLATRPSCGARIGFSIFIASTTTRPWPRFTAPPTAALALITRPGIGASSPPAA